jgi:hypothetical protein
MWAILCYTMFIFKNNFYIFNRRNQMDANIFGNRFYGNRIPAWHAIGHVSQIDQSATDALTAIGGGHIVEKYPNYAYIDGKFIPTGDFVLTRLELPDDNRKRFFGHVSERYNVLGSLEVAELFDDAVSQPCETIGFLGRGERMFLTWKMPSIFVKETDEVQTYGFVATGFDSLLGTALYLTTIRVVCQNTWSAAIAKGDTEKERGKGRIWSGKHVSGNMKRDLGAWMGHIQKNTLRKNEQVASLFDLLATRPLQEEKEVYRLLFSAFPDPSPLDKENTPRELWMNEQDKIDDIADKASKSRDGILALFSGAGTAIDANYYGLFNATTEWFNWGQGTKKPAEVSIVMGNRSAQMNKMVNVLYNDLIAK